ncbi:class I SAM-dependent methyltransferase [Sneathiella glossodoripedis]|uniref:class I SAM-dependent methyltransferase n=1 Tax=Sneathiella glossodoripedis TaxID=418853 RepID=UPI000471CFD1|nr:class I SAM-dependent methyltransferase [Sneathiella glossodoripedis]
MTSIPKCRFCGTELKNTFVDLGETPLANSYLKDLSEFETEKSYPLHARVCSSCFLVQVEDVVPAEEIFSDYAYFSSFSSSWVEHAKLYSERLIQKLSLNKNSLVVEVASNDGYLLQHFAEHQIPVLGIEPAANVASVAKNKNIPTEIAFFGEETAKRLSNDGYKADLIAANNVMAHVPDINDFVAGFPIILAADGVLTIEFPHLLNLIDKTQFDTIYHEHYSYLSLLTVETILRNHGLRVFDVEELPTHGGSLRVYACHDSSSIHQTSDQLKEIRLKEKSASLDCLSAYEGFAPKVEQVKKDLLSFLNTAVKNGKKVVGYGAAAKGNTLLNYCKISANQIEFVVDKNPEKQGTYLPGSHIPVYSPDKILEIKPDYVLILPWNLTQEITQQMSSIKQWDGQFVTPIPSLKII